MHEDRALSTFSQAKASPLLAGLLLPLRWEPSFPEKAVLPDGTEPTKQWEAALASTRCLRQSLDANGRTAQRPPVLGDGDFSVRRIFVATAEGWPEKESLLAGMRNAVDGPLRG